MKRVPSAVYTPSMATNMSLTKKNGFRSLYYMHVQAQCRELLPSENLFFWDNSLYLSIPECTGS